MLKLKNRAQSQSEEELELLGTVRELIGKDGLIYPSNSNNLKNVSKRMQITLQDKAGTKEVLLTSPECNRRLRSKEISLTEVLDYPVYLTLVKDQETGVTTEQARIGVNRGAEVKVMAVKADAKAVVAKEPKATIATYEGYVRY
jgi:hypothetical protein